MRVCVAAKQLDMPSCCACCGEPATTTIASSFARVSGKRVIKTKTVTWQFPFCGTCVKHDDTWPKATFGEAFVLTFLTAGLYLYWYVKQRSRSRALCTGACAPPCSSITYNGWHGTTHWFNFASPHFTKEFVGLNAKKIVDVDPAATVLLAALPTPSPIQEVQAVPNVPIAQSKQHSVAALSPNAIAPLPGPSAHVAPPQTPYVPFGQVASSPSPVLTPWNHVPSVHIPSSPRTVSTFHFVSDNNVITVAGRTIQRPFAYFTENQNTEEASAIVTSLPVGRAQHSQPLPYWPSYAAADQHQRARYLDWMAAGRTDKSVDLGYVFIFFYGLERRALVDQLDHEFVRAEVKRLWTLYGMSSSFTSYASSLLTFMVLPQLERATEHDLDSLVLTKSPTPVQISTTLAWYAIHGQKLPVRHAMAVVRNMGELQRHVVVERAFDELIDLFMIRYKDKFGEGMELDVSKNPETLAYKAASPSLIAEARRLRINVPHVLGKPSQFKPLVALWNQCAADLKKLQTAKRKSPGAPLTAAAWLALPIELRDEYGHPDHDRWNAAYAACPRVGDFRIITASQLAKLGGIEVKEKVSGVVLGRIAETAAHLYYAIEPDPRVAKKTVSEGAEFVIWATANPEVPDRMLWGSVFTMLSLALQVALADGELGNEESKTVGSLIDELFTLDESMRTRVAGMRHLLTRNPSRVTSLAKKLTSTKKAEDLTKVGRVLVAVAGADGVITNGEYKSLKNLYRVLNLGASELAAAIVASGARLADDIPVIVRAGMVEERGEQIPRPAGEPSDGQLNRHAIASILAETREVAMMLSSVLDAEDESDAQLQPRPPSAKMSPNAETPISAPAAFASLDVRYHALVKELLAKPVWTVSDVRAVATKMKLMPGAILEAVNSWSEEQFGDYLITEEEDWRINAKLIEGAN